METSREKVAIPTTLQGGSELAQVEKWQGQVAELGNLVSERAMTGETMLLNLGPSAVTSAAGAYAVGELVKPASVIATHVNEGATTDGKVRPASRTAAFAGMVKGRPVYLALSGRTMEFDGDGRCTSGCAQP